MSSILFFFPSRFLLMTSAHCHQFIGRSPASHMPAPIMTLWLARLNLALRNIHKKWKVLSTRLRNGSKVLGPDVTRRSSKWTRWSHGHRPFVSREGGNREISGKSLDWSSMAIQEMSSEAGSKSKITSLDNEESGFSSRIWRTKCYMEGILIYDHIHVMSCSI